MLTRVHQYFTHPTPDLKNSASQKWTTSSATFFQLRNAHFDRSDANELPTNEV